MASAAPLGPPMHLNLQPPPPPPPATADQLAAAGFLPRPPGTEMDSEDKPPRPVAEEDVEGVAEHVVSLPVLPPPAPPLFLPHPLESGPDTEDEGEKRASGEDENLNGTSTLNVGKMRTLQDENPKVESIEFLLPSCADDPSGDEKGLSTIDADDSCDDSPVRNFSELGEQRYGRYYGPPYNYDRYHRDDEYFRYGYEAFDHPFGFYGDGIHYLRQPNLRNGITALRRDGHLEDATHCRNCGWDECNPDFGDESETDSCVTIECRGSRGFRVGPSLSNPCKWTCFLNCILQCVIHTVPLVWDLLNAYHPDPCPRVSDEFCCHCSLKLHAHEVIRNTGNVLYPKKFVKLLKFILPDFQNGRHEDAHEFLRCLLDKLDEASVSHISASEEPSSIVKDNFGGRLKSQLHCPQCDHCSDTFEPFLDLNLEVSQMKTVMDALQSFTKVEVIEDFICEGCKSRVNMEKHLKVEQAPEVLVIQLKRFQNDGNHISKIRDMVEYQLEMDLNPFMSFPDDVPPKYDLYGIVVHSGLPSRGHYVCYIRPSQTDWYLFDDAKVFAYHDEAEVLNKEAYLLFYVKQGSSPWFISLIEMPDSSSSEEEYSDSYESTSSPEQDTADYRFVGPSEKNETDPCFPELSKQVQDLSQQFQELPQQLQGSASVSTILDETDKKKVRISLEGEPSGETHKLICPPGLSCKNACVGGLKVLLENKERVSPQGSQDTKEMEEHSKHGSSHVNNADTTRESPQKDGSKSSHKHEDNTCPHENLHAPHKYQIRGSSDSPTEPMCVRRRIGTSEFRTVSSNSGSERGDRNDGISKDDGDETKGRKRKKPTSADEARKRNQKRRSGVAMYMSMKRRKWPVKKKLKKRQSKGVAACLVKDMN